MSIDLRATQRRSSQRRSTQSGSSQPSASDLRGDELRAMLELVEVGHDDDPGEAMPWSVMERLYALVPCDKGVSFYEADFVHGVDLTDQEYVPGARKYAGAGAGAPDSSDAFWSLFWGSNLCSYPQRTGDLVRVIMDGDFSTVAQRRNEPMYVDFLWPGGVANSLILSLPAPPGRLRRLLFHRGPGAEFTERDRQVLVLLRPHLAEIWSSAERKRRGAPSLTSREWEVVALAAAGLSNREIARELFVSPGTVRKHMDNVFERLGVHSRTAAVAMALPHVPYTGIVPYNGIATPPAAGLQTPAATNMGPRR
jgi:DNA-binding CsgD family transcriptional regulator